MKDENLIKLQQEIRDIIEKYDPEATWALFVKDNSSEFSEELEEKLQEKGIESSKLNPLEKILVATSKDTTDAILVTALGLRGIVETTNNSELRGAISSLILGNDINQKSRDKDYSFTDDLKSSFKNSSLGNSNTSNRSSRGSAENLVFRRKYNCNNLQELVSLGIDTNEKDEVYYSEKSKILQLYKAGSVLKFLKKKIKDYSSEK